MPEASDAGTPQRPPMPCGIVGSTTAGCFPVAPGWYPVPSGRGCLPAALLEEPEPLMADLLPVASSAAPLPAPTDIARAERFTRERFVHEGEDAGVALAAGGARRGALDDALAELAQGA